MHCPLCKKFVAEGEDLQFHYLLDCSAYTANREPDNAENGESMVAVRFRWAKVDPCVERIVHLISSLAGSIALHWNDLEGLYESSLTTVIVGKHSCQLAIGGDVVPVQDFDIEKDTDVMYIVPLDPDDIEEDLDTGEDIVEDGDDPVADLLASRSVEYQRDEQTPDIGARPSSKDDGEPQDDPHEDRPIEGGNPIELSPLYKELLQHQVLHGEPSWIPSSGDQSPMSSDQEIEDLIHRAKAVEGPPLLTSQPANPDERLLRSPIPVKPIDSAEAPSENTRENVERNTGAKVTKGDGSSSSSVAISSGSSSKQSSGHSSQANSPPLDSEASDDSLPLQEQSLEESIPRIDELPCPYGETFTNSNMPDKEPPKIAARAIPQNHCPSGESPQDRPPSARSTESESRAIPQDRPLSARSSQSETRASQQDRLPSARSAQSEARASPQDRPPSARSSHSEARASPQHRPPSANSQSENKASTQNRPPIVGCSHSEKQVDPQDEIQSSTSDQSGTRTSPHYENRHPVVSSIHSDTRTSPYARTSPYERPKSARSDQLDTRVNRFDRPSSAQSTQSERVNYSKHPLTPELIQRRFSGPSGYPIERRTPPLSNPQYSHSHLTGELPSPSEPSPSISRRSSERSTPHGSQILPDRPQNGFPVDLAYSRENHALRHGIEKLQQSRPTAFAKFPDMALPPSTSRENGKRDSVEHRINGSRTVQDLEFVGHSIFSSRNALAKGAEQENWSPDQQTAHERFAEELSKKEKEIKELKILNEELCQQLLNLEAAATITEQDLKRSEGLDRTVQALKQRLAEKDNEVTELKKRCTELERENQIMKDEQESLKTVNKLTYEDLNKVNSDLLAERSDILRRKTYGSPMRSHTDDTIPQIENTKKTLQQKVLRLETEKRDLKQKYNSTKTELEKTKAEKTISEFRLTRAKSEADLRDKFDRLTDYKPLTDRDIVGYRANKTGSSGLGSSLYTRSDTNREAAYGTGSYSSPNHTHLNGSTSRKYDGYTRREDPSIYGTSRRNRETLDKKMDDRSKSSHIRHRSLSSESSSSSSLLEYEYSANIRIPYDATNESRDKRIEWRKSGTGKRNPRSHSFNAGTSSYHSGPYKHHYKSSSYSTSRLLDHAKPRDYGRTTRHESSFTSDSLYGVRDYSKPFLPISTSEIRLGKRVVVMRTCGNVGRGVVCYVGALPGREGTYVGVELDSPDGKHDGTFNGKQYFKCGPNKGIFVKFDKVIMCHC